MVEAKNRSGNRLKFLALTALVALGLAGCQHGERQQHNFHALVSEDLELRHPIDVEKKAHSIKVPVSRSANGLSYTQQSRVGRFVRQFRNGQGGKLFVSAPASSSNEVAVFNAVNKIQKIAQKNGVSNSMMRVNSHHGSGNSNAITMSFRRYVAVGPECGLWPDDMGHDPENRPYSEFGCATQKNLAAAIDNPRDLIEPRGMTPRSSERRSRAWDSYVNGESTVSESSEEEAGNISEIGN